MFSTAIARTARQLRPFLVVRASSSSTSMAADGVDIFANEKNPERDHANFPRRERPIHPGPVRHHCVPEEWFQFFYPKTGVTGPYMFAASFTTYLLSKEIWVLEHEFYSGIAFAIVIGGAVRIFSPVVNPWVIKEMDQREQELDSSRQNEIKNCKDAIVEEETAQWMGSSYEQLIEAKRENAALQLEEEYRKRVQEAFVQVKRRLDYKLQTANVIRAHEQKHMVDWIISNVRKSITPKQEEDALKRCVADLKALAQ